VIRSFRHTLLALVALPTAVMLLVGSGLPTECRLHCPLPFAHAASYAPLPDSPSGNREQQNGADTLLTSQEHREPAHGVGVPRVLGAASPLRPLQAVATDGPERVNPLRLEESTIPVDRTPNQPLREIALSHPPAQLDDRDSAPQADGDLPSTQGAEGADSAPKTGDRLSRVPDTSEKITPSHEGVNKWRQELATNRSLRKATELQDALELTAEPVGSSPRDTIDDHTSKDHIRQGGTVSPTSAAWSASPGFVTIDDSNGQTSFDPALAILDSPSWPEVSKPRASSRISPPTAQVAESPAESIALPRSRSTILVLRRAEEHTQYAFYLAEQSAVYSARKEFIKALELVTQVLDAEHGTDLHSRSLASGLRALEEGDSFAPKGLRYETDIKITELIAVHKTPVLKAADTSQVTPIVALQSYYLYATEQLTKSGGYEPVASMALYGLARLESVPDRPTGVQKPMAGPKAIVFHQAALMIDRRNYLTANELGVLLIRCGRVEEGKDYLLHSLSISQQPETWHNLSMAYRNLGDLAAAEEASQRHKALVAAERASAGEGSHASAGEDNSLIRWVDPETFANQASPFTIDGLAVNTEQTPAPQPTADSESAKRGFLAPIASFFSLGPPKTRR